MKKIFVLLLSWLMFFSFFCFGVTNAADPINIPMTCTKTCSYNDSPRTPILDPLCGSNNLKIGPFDQSFDTECEYTSLIPPYYCTVENRSTGLLECVPCPPEGSAQFGKGGEVICTADVSDCETATINFAYDWSSEAWRPWNVDGCGVEIVPNFTNGDYFLFGTNEFYAPLYPNGSCDGQVTGNEYDTSSMCSGSGSGVVSGTPYCNQGEVSLRLGFHTLDWGWGSGVGCGFTGMPTVTCTPAATTTYTVCDQEIPGVKKIYISKGECETVERIDCLAKPSPGPYTPGNERYSAEEWLGYYSCSCVGLVCDIVEQGVRRGCRVDTGTGDTVCFEEAIERVYANCARPVAGSRFCEDNKVYENIDFENCIDDGVDVYCDPQTQKKLIDDCGGCTATGNQRCAGSKIQVEYICEVCSAGECLPGAPVWKDAIDCGPAQTVEFSWCAKSQPALPGVSCTLTADYPGVCFYMDEFQKPCTCPIGSVASCGAGGSCVCTECPPDTCGGDVATTTCTAGTIVGGCKAPTVDIVCDGVCNDSGGDTIPDDLIADDLTPDDLIPDDLFPDDLVPVPDDLIPPDLIPDDLWPDDTVPPADDLIVDDVFPDDDVPIPDDFIPDDFIPDDDVPIPDDLIPDDLYPDDDYPPVDDYHYECTLDTCTAVDGPGINSCDSNADCQNDSHTECALNETCQVVYKPGENTCFYNSDCTATHNTCNRRKQCVVTAGSGDDLCYTNGDCLNNSHNECDGSQCIVVEGRGLDYCNSDSDCLNSSHTECNLDGDCVPVSGPGFNICSDSLFCTINIDTVCNIEKQCVAVSGTGQIACHDNEDCQETHNECNVRNQCVAVAGADADQCISICDCQNGRHSECTPQKTCQTIYGIGGFSNCLFDSDCSDTHNECVLDKCEAVNGIGTDACFGPDPDSYCINDTDNHRNMCMIDNSCVSVLGEEGYDDCDPTTSGVSTDCQEDKYHNECNYLNQCVVVAGAAIDECQIDQNCVDQNNPPTAYELNVSLTTSAGYCMGIGGLFSWKYGDIDLDHEIRFILEINDDPDFINTPEVRKVVSGIYYTSGSTNQQPIYVVSPGKVVNDDSINYNTAYYWRVKVSDEHGLDSAWTYFNGNGNNGTTEFTEKVPYTFTGHSAPSPEFNVVTDPLALDTPIEFDDLSICYSNLGAYSCFVKRADDGYNDYSWWFGDAGTPYVDPPDRTEAEDVSHIGDVSHIYTKTSTGVTLQVCDELGKCCGVSHPLKFKTDNTGGGIWREISPF